MRHDTTTLAITDSGHQPEDGGGFVVVDGAQQLPGLAAPRLGPAEVHSAAHAVREGDGAWPE